MNFEYPKKTEELIKKVDDFMQKHLFPHEKKVYDFHKNNPWKDYPELENWKKLAKKEGLWNLFLPSYYGDLSPGYSNLEYAPLAEKMGRLSWASEVFNCNAPDTGNMETIAKYGTTEQKEKWLKPIMNGEIRSAFLMTEPAVASSDATNIQTSITKDGDDYVINGRKWWSSGAMNPHCKIYILMGKTDFKEEKHKQQSMILVPADTPGIKILRPLEVFGSVDSPEGHAEIELTNVRVPANNILLGEGRGFEIAQGRLGPGRIHHCMRWIGICERALDLMCKRVSSRELNPNQFLSEKQTVQNWIAESAAEIYGARLMVMDCAKKVQEFQTKGARKEISMIKLCVADVLMKVLDRAIQAHGALGITDYTPLAYWYRHERGARIYDGADEVHKNLIARTILKNYID